MHDTTDNVTSRVFGARVTRWRRALVDGSHWATIDADLCVMMWRRGVRSRAAWAAGGWRQDKEA
jgi:hypothetical protein